MEKRDYYEVLGVSTDANDAELKKGYKRLAMRYHPDRNKDDSSAEGKFKEVKEAYDILSDKRQRAAYDQFGHAGVGNNNDGLSGSNVSDIFEGVFGDIFGGRSRGGSQHASGGADLRYDLTLDMEDAVNGIETKIKVSKFSQCGVCNGSGAKKGSKPTTCNTCAGHGQVRMQQGFFSLQQTCPECRGQGTIIKNGCNKCHGKGRVKDNKTIPIQIPPGVDNGDRIRLSNEGEAGENGAPYGDMYVHINVREHEIFRRDNNNLYCDVPIGYTMAALGGELEVLTLDGRVSLTLPKETQSGESFRLRAKGVRSVRSASIGDLFCRVIIETPVDLNKTQKQLLIDLEKSMEGKNGIKHSPKVSSWLKGVKKFLDKIKN